MKAFAKRAKKVVVYAAGAASMAVAAGVLDDQTEAVVVGILSILTGLGIYQAKNQEPATTAATNGGLGDAR